MSFCSTVRANCPPVVGVMLMVISSRSGGPTAMQPHPDDDGGIGVGMAKPVLLVPLLALIMAIAAGGRYPESSSPANGCGEEVDDPVSLPFVLLFPLLLPDPSIAVISVDGCFEVPSIVCDHESSPCTHPHTFAPVPCTRRD